MRNKPLSDDALMIRNAVADSCNDIIRDCRKIQRDKTDYLTEYGKGQQDAVKIIIADLKRAIEEATNEK